DGLALRPSGEWKAEPGHRETAAGCLNESSAGESHGDFSPREWSLVGRIPGRIRLPQRLGALEGVDLHAFGEDALDRGHAARRDLEVARGKNLPGEADIGHRRRVAVAEPAGLALLRKMRFERFEP